MVRRLSRTGAILAQRLEPGQPRHRQVEQQQRRLRRADDADGLLATARFSNHLESGADVDAVNILDHGGRHGQQLAQAGAEQALVIRQDDTDRAVRRPWPAATFAIAP